MDIDLNLLGPYATLLKNEGGDSKNKRAGAQSGTYRRANFEALYKKQNIKFIQDSDARRQGRQQKMEEHRRGRRSQIIAVGRKPTITEMTNDLNVMIQDDSSNEISELEGSDLSSLSTSQQKKGASETSNMDTLNGNEASAENSSKDMEIENSVEVQNAVNGVTTSKTTTSNKNDSKQAQSKKPTDAQSIKDSRRDQLQKWKKEKQAADMKTKLVQKQPFKVGAPVPPPVPAKPVKTTSTTSLASARSANSTASSILGGSKSTISASTNKTTSGATSARGPASGRVAPSSRGVQLAAVSKTASKTVAPPVAKQPEVRRVTRAMTKTQTTSTAAPPAQRIKTQLATTKPGTAGTKPTTASTVPASKTAKPTGRTGVTATSSATAGVSKKGAAAPVSLKEKKVEGPAQSKLLSRKERTPTPPQSKKKSATPPPAPPSNETSISVQEPPKEQVVKKKKAKPKPIDGTYTDYNGRFSDACRKLSELRTEWKNILDGLSSEAIAEDILDEIHSALGKVKLLLESKLPQFGELLYAYLCKNEEETLILACDLEGWWDVAYIQVEAVYKIFDALSTLKNNQWRKSEPLPPTKSSSRRKGSEGEKLTSDSDKGFVPPPQPRPLKPKAQASGGLKAFLASKRKMLNPESDTTIIPAPAASEEKMDVSSATVPTVVVQVQPVTPTVKQIQGLKPCPENLDIDGDGDLHSSNKMFEGGFFSISSPVATPTTTPQRRRKRDSNVSGAESSTSQLSAVLRTPNRPPRLSGISSSSDASLRRASFTMLGVRRSMGTLSRLGVVPVFTEAETEADSV